MEKDFQQWVTQEASRCLFCDDAPCSRACPAHVDVPQFVRLLRWGDVRGAKRVIKRENCLGGICAYVCPSEELCEKNCNCTKLGNAIPIARLQKFACDNGGQVSDWNSVSQLEAKVAVIGAGPAGLSCAHHLSRFGYRVNVYEKENFMAGTVAREIPDFKIPDHVIEQDMKELDTEGIIFHMGEEISPEFLAEHLSKKSDAVFVAMGVGKSRRASIAGEEMNNVFDAASFLSGVKEKQITSLQGVCVVIGGGNTAMDCARTALRLGATRAIIAYRRSLLEMPADREDYLKAVKDGVEFLWQVSPVGLKGDDGSVRHISLMLTEPIPSKSEGRRKFEPVEGSEFTYPAGAVVLALGKEPDRSFTELSRLAGNQVNPDSLRIGESNLFAGGDCISRRQTVVEAVGQGKKAAYQIHEYLCQRSQSAKSAG